MFAVGRWIVARPAEPEIEPEPRALADDVRLGHVLERRLDAERIALDPRLGREFGQPLECGDEFGTAIRITRIIERVDADIDIARTRRLGPAEREAEEDRIAGGDIGDGNATRIIGADTVLGHVDIGGERRTAERGQVHRQDDVAFGAERGGDAARGVELDAVALVIIERQREQAPAGFPQHGGGNHRVEAARDEGDR